MAEPDSPVTLYRLGTEMQGDGSKGIVMLQCQAEIVVAVQKGL